MHRSISRKREPTRGSLFLITILSRHPSKEDWNIILWYIFINKKHLYKRIVQVSFNRNQFGYLCPSILPQNKKYYNRVA